MFFIASTISYNQELIYFLFCLSSVMKTSKTTNSFWIRNWNQHLHIGKDSVPHKVNNTGQMSLLHIPL